MFIPGYVICPWKCFVYYFSLTKITSMCDKVRILISRFLILMCISSCVLVDLFILFFKNVERNVLWSKAYLRSNHFHNGITVKGLIQVNHFIPLINAKNSFTYNSTNIGLALIIQAKTPKEFWWTSDLIVHIFETDIWSRVLVQLRFLCHHIVESQFT